MTLLISGLKKDQIRALEFYLRRKYKCEAKLDALLRIYLLDFVVAQSKKYADAAIEKLNSDEQ